MFKRTAIALATMIAGSATAQVTARPDPADPKASVPPRTAYESAFKGYRPHADPEVGRWRESNEEMGKLKGHVGHVPKAQGPAVKPAAQGGHGSHK